MNIFKTNILGNCPEPGSFCDYIKSNAEVLVVILCLDGFIFFVTLLPPLFSWSNKKPDGRKRIYFAALACFTFYFWLAFLAVNSLYCFGFLAHHGPCKKAEIKAENTSVVTLKPTLSPIITSTTITSSTLGRNNPTLPENSIERPASTSHSPTVLASTSSITSLLTLTSGASIGKKGKLYGVFDSRLLLLLLLLVLKLDATILKLEKYKFVDLKICMTEKKIKVKFDRNPKKRTH